MNIKKTKHICGDDWREDNCPKHLKNCCRFCKYEAGCKFALGYYPCNLYPNQCMVFEEVKNERKQN